MSDHSHGTRKKSAKQIFFSWLLLAKLQLFFNCNDFVVFFTIIFSK